MDIFGFLITSAVLTLMPGPDILYVLVQGLAQGRKPALSVSLGLASGLLVHTAAAALGLSLIIARSPLLLNVIKYAGVAYLIYMGIKAFMGRNRPEEVLPGANEESELAKAPFGKLFRVGVTMNLLNPKVILFFLALFPQFLDPGSATPRADIFILGGIFAVQAWAIFSLVSLLSGFLAHRFSADRLSHKAVSWINVVVYWAIALVFLWTKMGS